MDDIKLFAKSEKELEILILTVKIYGKQKGIRYWIEKMCHANNEKRKPTNVGRNRTTKLGKNQNARGKENFQLLGNTGNWHNHTCSGERKKKVKSISEEGKKLLETKLNSWNLIKRINTKAVTLERYLGSFLSWTLTSTNRIENKKTNDDAQSHTSKRWHRHIIWVKKRRLKSITMNQRLHKKNK